MPATSRVPDIIDLLISLFKAASTLGGASPPVAVYDGPVVTQAPAQLELWVGVDDVDASGGPLAAEGNQMWAALGKMAIDEDLGVWCTAQAWSGDTDVRTQRLNVYSIVGAVSTVLRTDPSFGPLLWDPPVIGEQRLHQANTEPGALARVTFRIDCKARIGG